MPPSRKDTIVALNEGFNPAMWALNGAKAVGRGIGAVAKGMLPHRTVKAANTLTGRYSPSKAAGAEFDNERKRRAAAARPPKLPVQRNAAQNKKEHERVAANQHKRINPYLLANGLKSTQLTNMPTLKTGKGSWKFALVDPNTGELLNIFYPFALQSATAPADDDVGYINFDAKTKSFSAEREKLRDSSYAAESGFITLQNSVSGVPTYSGK